MARPTPKEILELKPHIVEHVYDENGKEIGWIADNFVVQTQKECLYLIRAGAKPRNDAILTTSL